ncbi:helix-turn-helix domain-containing protein [Nocardiopsis alba]|uniref:helix-turn-helix domain-containing protein n=1 Tax=Nocardiopsis alba TaxID=53437 RepID=UPI0033C00BE6
MSGYARIARGDFGGDRFTIVANAAIRDPHLSYKACGLLALIASHREGWGITEKRLADQSPDGISSVRSGLKELEAAGYLRRYRVRNELGQLGGAHWVITDDPTSLNARVTDLAGALGKDGGDLVPLPMSRSGPKCDFPKSAEPTEAEPPEDDRAPKKTNHKNTVATESGEGEEDARARANGSPVDNPHEWGIDPADRPGAEQGALLARTVVSQIAEETGLGLAPGSTSVLCWSTFRPHSQPSRPSTTIESAEPNSWNGSAPDTRPPCRCTRSSLVGALRTSSPRPSPYGSPAPAPPQASRLSLLHLPDANRCPARTTIPIRSPEPAPLPHACFTPVSL